MGNMKDSGIEWIGMIPEEWAICRIKDKYQLITGFTPDTARDDFYDDDNGYTWISIADMTKEGKNISESSAGISDVYIRSKHPEIVKKGSLLYSFKLSVGKVGFAQKELYTNEAIASFQEDDNICLEYLYYAAFLIEENANINIYGAKILNQDLINNSITIFPPLSEQQLIADFLDDKVGKIDDILSDLTKQVETLQKYKRSVITKAVTKGLDSSVAMKDSGVEWIGEIPESWNYIRLKFCVDTTKGYAFNTDLFTDEGVMVVRASDMKYNTLLQSDVYISNSDSVKYKKVMLKENDIIVSTVGSRPEVVNSAVGQISIVPLEFEGALLNQNTVILKPYDVLNKYMFYYLQCNAFREYMNLYAHGTVNQASLSLIDILNYYFCIPTKPEQQQIADYLDDKCAKIDELIKDKEAQIEKMEKYKKSMIYEYVTGKKRVKGV